MWHRFQAHLAAGLVACSLGLLAAPTAWAQHTGKRAVAQSRAEVDTAELLRRSTRERGIAVVGEEHGVDAPLPTPDEAPASARVSAVTSPVTSAIITSTTTDLPASPAPALSFMALADSGSSIPPDTQGAVGPRHIVAATNPEVRYQTRDGGILTTISRTSFWSPLPGVSGTFDPRVLYDELHNRWIIVAVSNRRSAESSVLIAVSRDDSPEGGWYMYRVAADPAGQNWADFPIVGYNRHWIAVSFNNYANTGDTFRGSQVVAFDKADLYANGSGAHTRFTASTNYGSFAPAVVHDATLDRLYLVSRLSSFSGTVRISSISGSAGAPVFNLEDARATSPLGGWEGSTSEDLAPQLASTMKIDVSDARVQNVVYRGGTLWFAHTVLLPVGGATRSAVQWWQVTPTGAVRQAGRVDDPAGMRSFAYPSIAVNRNQDVLVGYSAFSASDYAGAAYSYRLAADPAGTLRGGHSFKTGEGTYYKTFSGTRNRWGDYSSSVVDPVNGLDFWTVQEFAAGGNAWGTYWARVNAVAPAAEAPQLAASVSPLDFGGVLLGLSKTLALTVRNNGTQALAISGFEASGNFTQTNDCGTSLRPATACTVTLTFRPASMGVERASVTVWSGGTAAAAFQLSGTGVELSVTINRPRRPARQASAGTHQVEIRPSSPSDETVTFLCEAGTRSCSVTPQSAQLSGPVAVKVSVGRVRNRRLSREQGAPTLVIVAPGLRRTVVLPQ